MVYDKDDKNDVDKDQEGVDDDQIDVDVGKED